MTLVIDNDCFDDSCLEKTEQKQKFTKSELKLDDSYFDQTEETEQKQQPQSSIYPTYSDIYYIKNICENTTCFTMNVKDCVQKIAGLVEKGFYEKFKIDNEKLFVKPYFDFDYKTVEKNELTKLVTSLNKVSEHYGPFIMVGYFKKQCDPDTNDDVLSVDTIDDELARLGYIIYKDSENNKISIYKLDKNRIILYETPENVEKALSVHVTYYERAALYKNISKQQNEVHLFDDYLDAQCDKSVYSKTQLMRFAFSNKSDKDKIIKTGIPVTNDMKRYYLRALIQPTEQITILDNFSEVFITKKAEPKPILNNKKCPDNGEKKHLTLPEQLILEVKTTIQKLLNNCCQFAGHKTIINEQSLYVPNNEETTYGTTYFKDAYIDGFNSVDHKTKDENFDKMPNAYGVLHCLANLVNKCLDNYSKDETLSKERREELFKDVYRDGLTVMKHYINNYNLDKNDSSITKFERKYNEIFTDKLKMASKLYRYYYLHKVAFSYSGKIILKNDPTRYVIKDDTDRNLRSIIRKFLNKSKLVESDIAHLRYVESINGEKLDCPAKANLNLYNFSWLDDECSDKYTVKDFIKFKTLLYEETYKNKLSGQFSYKMLVHDIKNKFSRKSHLGFVRFLFGNGATFKTSEYVLYQNIINNIDYVMSTDIANYMKQQKKKILSSLVLLVDEVPMTGTDFMNFIDMVKTNCMNGVIGVRGMGEEESQQVVNCRHILCTNHDNIASLLISDRAEINRRFLIAEKINDLCPEDNEWLGEHVHDPDFCKEFAKWVYQNEEDPKLKITSLNEYNKNNEDIKSVTEDKFDTLFYCLPPCERVKRYKNKDEIAYMVDVKAWHDKYCAAIAKSTIISSNNIEFEKLKNKILTKVKQMYRETDTGLKTIYNRQIIKPEYVKKYLEYEKEEYPNPFDVYTETKEQISEPEPNSEMN